MARTPPRTRSANIVPPRARPAARQRPRRSRQTPNTKFRAEIMRDGDEWITQRTQPGATVLVDRKGGKVEILRTENFLLRFDERLRKTERFFDELIRYVADNAGEIYPDEFEEIVQRLEDEMLYVGENFRRGFPERLFVLLPDKPMLERKVAQLAKPLDNLRQLANQDYYEYTPAHLRTVKTSLRQRLGQLRQGFEVGRELSRIKGGAD